MVYFVTDGEHVKIGVTSSDVRAGCSFRVDSLQVGNPRLITVLATVQGNRGTEKSLHSFFEDIRVRGEWFLRTPRLMEYVSSLAGQTKFVSPKTFFNLPEETAQDRMSRVLASTQPYQKKLRF